jgi:hypothetical protein
VNLDFARLIKERTTQFTLREWVFKPIADWLKGDELLEDVVREAGPVVFGDVHPLTAQIGPDAATPA